MLIKALKTFFHLLFPTQCLICHECVSGPLNICEICIDFLPFSENSCSRCGLNISLKVESYCAKCIKNPPYFHTTLTLFEFKAPIVNFIHQLKFNQQLFYAKFFGLLMVRKLQTLAHPLPEILIPVPLHIRRKRKRGYNQSLQIAKFIKKECGIPILTKGIKRIKNNCPQATLTAKQRKKNVRNIFQLKKPIRFKHVAIIDDVLTTGSTVNELSRLLSNQGVEKIEIWCCARS